MTTIYPFTPNNQGPFQFSPELDGNTYNVQVTWSLFGARYYVNVYDLAQNLIVALPMIGSPSAYNLASLSWSHGLVTAETTEHHGYLINSTTDLVISGAAPDNYNGTVSAFIIDQSTFQYDVAQDPGPATTTGNVVFNINLVAGYFDTSTLVFRQDANQFEVMP